MTAGALSAADVFAPARAFNWLRADGGALLWTETRPAQARTVVVRWEPGSEPVDLTPPGRSSSNIVGYGGIPYGVAPDGDVLLCDSEDQRIHSVRRGVAVTPAAPGKTVRWSDFVVSGEHVYAVREQHHDDGRIANELVRVRLDGAGDPVVLDGGHDFVGSPRVSSDGARIAWITWDHPQMPWDGTQLWVAELTPAGIVTSTCVAGSAAESVLEPTWTPDGVLLFLSDRTGWWNLYRVGAAKALAGMEADMGGPVWFLGLRSLDVFADGRLVVKRTIDGVEHLGVRHPDGRLDEIATPYTQFASPTVVGDRIAVIAAGTGTRPPWC